MKKIFVFIFAIILFSCDEDELMKEVPLDFFAAENSYTEPEHFEIANVYMYNQIRKYYYTYDAPNWANMFSGTDVCYSVNNPAVEDYGDYELYNVPTNSYVKNWWNRHYKLIFNANAVITRIADVEFPSEAEKNAVLGEALFFRAFAYRTLVYLYGGVPLVLEEVTEPKRDFVRATKQEVLLQMVEDFKFAGDHLPGVSEIADGKVSNSVANHYLAETYLALEQWDNAITASSKVIDDPNNALMTSRFGTRTDVPNTDVFWDLFQYGNQNRSIGNTEGLWVIQLEFDKPGGGGSSSIWSGESCKFPRWFGPALQWFIDPVYNARPFPQPSGFQAGRSMGHYRGTTHALWTVWRSDFDNDIRNSEENISREYWIENPDFPTYGQNMLDVYNPDDYADLDTIRRIRPNYTKVLMNGAYPDLLCVDVERQWLTSHAGATYTDQYMLRLPETYLVRAEAKLGKGDANGAAADINVIRLRSNANPVAAGDVNIDYILDERIRELCWEEKRRLTLGRLGLLYDRTKRYNEWAGLTIKGHHNVYPIPFDDIERNTGAVLEQNPGYTN